MIKFLKDIQLLVATKVFLQIIFGAMFMLIEIIFLLIAAYIIFFSIKFI